MNKKILIPTIIGVAGLILIFKEKLFGKKKELVAGEDVDKPDEPKEIISGSTVTDNFPLKFGSRGSRVRELQTLLGVKADGIFGRITEAEVMKYLGKSSVDNQQDMIRIKALKQVESSKSAKYKHASNLLNNFNANKSLGILPLVDTKAIGINLDYTNKYVPTGRNVILRKNVFLNRNDYVLKAVSNDGDLRFEITRGEQLAGWYYLDPYNITLKSSTTSTQSGTGGYNINSTLGILNR